MSGYLRRPRWLPRPTHLSLEVSNETVAPVRNVPFYHPRELASETEINLAAANIAAILRLRGVSVVSIDSAFAPPHTFYDPMLALDASQVALRSYSTRLGIAYDIGVGGYSPSAGRWVQHVTRLLLDIPAALGIMSPDVPCPSESFEL